MKYAKIEKIGVSHEGSDVLIELEGKQFWMPWTVATMLAQNIGKHALAARQHSESFQQIISEISHG